MDSAHSDLHLVESNFLFSLSSILRTDASLGVASNNNFEDDLSIKWNGEHSDSLLVCDTEKGSIRRAKRKKNESPKQPKAPKTAKAQKTAKKHKEPIEPIEPVEPIEPAPHAPHAPPAEQRGTQPVNHTQDVVLAPGPELPADCRNAVFANSQKSYSAFEDSLILNSRKSNKINVEREKFKGLAKLAVELNRTGLGVQNRSRFLMQFSREDKTRIVRFAADNPEKSKKCTITWEKTGSQARQFGDVGNKCLLLGFVKFSADQTKKRLYKERKRVLGCSGALTSLKDNSEIDENETTYNTEYQTKRVPHSGLEFENEFGASSRADQHEEPELDQISFSSLIFNRSDPEELNENWLLMRYIQEEGLMHVSRRRSSE